MNLRELKKIAASGESDRLEFKNIIEWCKENRNPPPEWIIRSGSVVLIFKPSPEKTMQQPESQLESQLESLPDRVTKLLQKGPLSKSEISKCLGQKRTSGQLNKVMKELLAELGVKSTFDSC